jgi:hypothetical protein
MRAARHEYKARPGLRLAPGEQPPKLAPEITPDFPISSTDTFDHQDWEGNCARRRDAETKSLFWYYQIEVHPDDVQALLQESEAHRQTKAAPESPEEPIDLPRTEWSEVQARSPLEGPRKPEGLLKGLKRPEGVPHKLWVVIRTLDGMEAGGDDLKAAYPNKEALRVAVSQRLSKDRTLSLRQLRKAEAWLREYKKSRRET